MLKIDAHQHFWKFDPVRDAWINDEMAVIQRDFFPEDLQPVLQVSGFDGCVAVQADQSEEETGFLLDCAEKNDFVKGVVGWVGLRSADVESRLEYYSQFKKLKGFRHILQGETQRDFMLRPDFLRGIKALKKFGYRYDILIYPDQLKYTPDFVSRFPDQPFVIDHIAKPYIKNNLIDEWMRDMEAVARYQNVYCKLSGMVTEADWKSWNNADLRPYIDVVVNSFGTDRIMYGSDWPVCLVAAQYKQVYDVAGNYFAGFSKTEQEKVFGGNAIRFYGLH